MPILEQTLAASPHIMIEASGKSGPALAGTEYRLIA